MLAKAFPVMEQVEARRLLAEGFGDVEWSLVMTNTVDAKDGGPYLSYLMLFNPKHNGLCFVDEPSSCMQDYSWLGKGFQPTTYQGVPAVIYVAREPYVVDPAAQKKWTVKQFLAEYPRALDGLPEEVRPHIDVFRVDTDRATGIKTVVLCNWNYEEEDYDRRLQSDWSASITLKGVPMEEALAKKAKKPVKGEGATKATNKKKAQRHHKKPVVKKAESVFLDRRFTAVRG
jgi:hypothetical protein